MKGKVRLKTITIFLMVAGGKCDFQDELKSSLVKLQDTVDKISLEQINTNKKVDQLQETVGKISLEQINANKKGDRLQETVGKISLEQISANKKVDQLQDTVDKSSLEQININKKVDQLKEKIEKIETIIITVEDLNEVNNNISDAINELGNELKNITLEKYTGNGCNEVDGNQDEKSFMDVSEEEEKAILVVGGWKEKTLKSVEAITTDGTPLCTLPDLPYEIRRHTMDDHIICGGYNDQSLTQSSCHYFIAGEWTKYRNDLKTQRVNHVSWRRQDGEVILFGGLNSKKTSEVVSSSGHQKAFNLQHEVSESCAIKLDDYFVITGGYPSVTTVSKYDKNGWVKDLTSMNTGRSLHACGHYYSDTNELIYLVTGGYNGKKIISTEVLSATGTSWSNVGNLPMAAYGMSGISVNNHIFVTGGYDVDNRYLNTILKFNPASIQWEKTGELRFARNHHAAAVLPLKEVKPYCL